LHIANIKKKKDGGTKIQKKGEGKETNEHNRPTAPGNEKIFVYKKAKGASYYLRVKRNGNFLGQTIREGGKKEKKDKPQWNCMEKRGEGGKRGF